ncbi:hypothetical protein [Castellaniella sp.]|uniref:hypothetical protein n=1 Tax=Castellaniella sp. TaxID=1955812 RepID=UPI002B001FFB|nr:hypothetical protein [Castellaniella sp.]
MSKTEKAPDMSSENPNGDDPGLGDILRNLIKLADDWGWDETQLATAIHAVVEPVSQLGTGNVAVSIRGSLYELERLILSLEGCIACGWDMPKSFLAGGSHFDEMIAGIISSALSKQFEAVEFFRMESIVLRALEIVRKNTEASA